MRPTGLSLSVASLIWFLMLTGTACSDDSSEPSDALDASLESMTDAATNGDPVTDAATDASAEPVDAEVDDAGESGDPKNGAPDSGVDAGPEAPVDAGQMADANVDSGPPGCVPDCTGLSCGDDGCGGSCGSCATGAGETCSAGQCVCTADATVTCDGADLHSVDSCGNVGGVSQQCAPAGCAFDTCCGAERVVIEQLLSDDFAGSGTCHQSFKVLENGRLMGVTLRPNAFGGGNGISGVFTIHDGEGPSGTVLSTQDYTLASVGSSPPQRFTLPVPLAVTAGQQLTWQITGTGGCQFGFGDPYPDGVSNKGAGVDMVFQIHMEACPDIP